MQLMRHESIDTTMCYYVGRSVQATADVVWEAYQKVNEQRTSEKTEIRDTRQIVLRQPEEQKDVS